MLLQIQNQFVEDYLKPLSRGEVKEMPAGYGKMFAKWQDMYPGLAHLSPNEQAISFAEFLDEEMKKQELALVTGDTLVDQKNKKLIERGQVLLASDDGGKTFTKLIKPEDIEITDAENLYLLSPTFRTTTNDLREVMNEQILLRIAMNLTSQNYLIQSTPIIENNVIHFEVKTPQFKDMNVLVDTAQKFDKPMNYVFVNKDGLSKVVPETQIDTKYGQIEPDPTLRPLSDAEIRARIVKDENASRELGVLGGILATVPNLGASSNRNNLIPTYTALNQQKNLADATSALIQDKADTYQNIRNAKIRFEESKKGNEQKAKFEEEKKEKADEADRKLIQAKTEFKTKKRKSGIHPVTKRAAKAGLGIATAIMATLVGTIAATTVVTTILT